MTADVRPAFEHRVGETGVVAVRIGSGRVRVRAVDGAAARVSTVDGRPVEDLVTIEAGEGSLQVGSRRHGLARLGLDLGPRTVELELDVPRRAALVVETAGADIATRDLAGDQRHRTTSGDVLVEGAAGSIRVEAVSGSIRVGGHRGEVVARSVSGDVAIRVERLDALVAASTSGDVVVAGALGPDADHRIETVSGDARVEPVGGLTLEAVTLAGRVAVRGPQRFEGQGPDRRLHVAGGGPRLAFRSMSGSLRVEPIEVARVEAGATADQATAAPIPGAAAPAAPAAPADTALTVLAELEAGRIDVDEAERRLRALGDRADA